MCKGLLGNIPILGIIRNLNNHLLQSCLKSASRLSSCAPAPFFFLASHLFNCDACWISCSVTNLWYFNFIFIFRNKSSKKGRWWISFVCLTKKLRVVCITFQISTECPRWDQEECHLKSQSAHWANEVYITLWILKAKMVNVLILI